MSTGAGVNVSKANAYAALDKSPGENVSKANLYATLEKTAGINVSKAVMYAVVIGGTPQIQQFVCIT